MCGEVQKRRGGAPTFPPCLLRQALRSRLHTCEVHLISRILSITYYST